MITRDIIRQLADIQSQHGDAITFYFQPDTPQDKSHRQEAIMVKDMVREAMRRAERAGKNGTLKSDLQRILDLAEQLHGNQGRAKLVFACGSQDLWREFDVPVRTGARTNLQINNRFHLKPLAVLSGALHKTCVSLIDRTNARFFEMQGESITEQEGITDELSRRGRSNGFEGYDAGHVERKFDNEATQHFKKVADRLMERYGNGQCDNIVIGCRDEIWAAVDRQLHPYIKQRLVGHVAIDPQGASVDEVRQKIEDVLADKRAKLRGEIFHEVLDQARANNNGALGLRRVLRSMEQGEVQKLLIGEGFSAEGVECGNCGHIDMRMVANCAVCGQKTHDIDDITDALIGRALRKNIEVMYIPGNAEFQKAGNIGALLRFRAERSTGELLA